MLESTKRKYIILLTIVIITLLLVFIGLRYILHNSTFKPHNAENIDYNNLNQDYFTTLSGNVIDVVYQKNKNKDYVIIYFHGNSGRAKSTIDYFRKNGYPFVSMAYPGYHGSSGKPNVKSINNSVSMLMHFIKQHFSENERKKMYIFGHSLGSQTALYFSSIYHNEITDIIIVNGFTSIQRICEYSLKKYHIQNLCFTAKDYFNSLSYVKGIHLPVYHQFHLFNDNVIPYDAGLQLYNTINTNNKNFTTLKNGTHHNFPHDDVFKVIIN